MAILINHRIAAIDHILRRFAKATAGIDVPTDGAGTLLSQKRLQIVVLANDLVAGREVEDDVGTCHRQIVARRNRCPHVLADLYAKLHAVSRHEEFRICTDRDDPACKIELRRIQILSRGKPALFIELCIVGQVSLWHQAQQCTALDNGCTVIEQAVDDNWQAHDGNDVQFTRKIEQSQDSRLGMIQQELLLEQVLT